MKNAYAHMWEPNGLNRWLPLAAVDRVQKLYPNPPWKNPPPLNPVSTDM